MDKIQKLKNKILETRIEIHDLENELSFKSIQLIELEKMLEDMLEEYNED